MRDLDLPEYPEEDYSEHHFVEWEEMENFVQKIEIEKKVEEALSAAIFEESSKI